MQPAETVVIEVCVNGRTSRHQVEARLLLSDFLRQELGLTGTHVGCEHGVCGACTVLVDGAAVRSCLLFAAQCADAQITTVEGLADPDGGDLHPIQRAFHEAHALQCGFCTPGFLMTLVPFLQENPAPDEAQVREALSGNLCRCTGYQKIVDATLLAATLLSHPSSVEPDSGEPQSGEPQSSEPQSSEPQSSEPQSRDQQSADPKSLMEGPAQP
jgi:carbon-monoxide dehydrogenase small subunit